MKNIIVILLLLPFILFHNAFSADIDPNASSAVDKFLKAYRIMELPEGRQMLTEVIWPQWGTNPVLQKAEMIFESMFDTDVAGVKGYKRVVDVQLLSKAKTPILEKYVIIAYPDKVTRKWKVLCFSSSCDFNESIEFGLQNLKNTITSLAINYRFLAYQYSAAGKLEKARDAYKKAAELNRQTPNEYPSQEEFDKMVVALNSIIGNN